MSFFLYNNNKSISLAPVVCIFTITWLLCMFAISRLRYWSFLYKASGDSFTVCKHMHDILPPSSTALGIELILCSNVQETQNVVFFWIVSYSVAGFLHAFRHFYPCLL